MTTKPRILVTSAAGRNASTAVLELLRMGFPVRAFVRRDDVRSETLRDVIAMLIRSFLGRNISGDR